MPLSILPGTTIETQLYPGAADSILTPLFYSGGLVLSQVCQLTGLEGYIIQNWIKRKFLTPPTGKKYTRRQLCRILIINILKEGFSLDQAAALLSYINGVLTSYDDDLIDDSQLYSYFVDCLASIDAAHISDPEHLTGCIQGVISLYQSTLRYAKDRLLMVLKIMVMSYHALLIKQQAVTLFNNLDYQ